MPIRTSSLRALRRLLRAAPLVFLLPAHAAAEQPRYSLQVMDVARLLGPDARVGPAGFVNDHGEVAGVLFRDTGSGLEGVGAFVWSSDTDTARVVEIDGLFEAPRIDDSGRLAGVVSHPGIGSEPFLWTPGIGLERAGFAGRTLGLNDLGQVVGRRFDPSLGFVWDPVSGRTDLPALAGDPSSAAVAINDASVVVGTSGSPDAVRAALWDPAGGVSPLPAGGFELPIAQAINEIGQIVGIVSSPDLFQAGAFWASRDAEPVLLPCAGPLETRCWAIDVNDRGEILGVDDPDEADAPILWIDGGSYVLSDLVDEAPQGVFLTALAINDRGQIGARAAFLDSDGNLVQAPAILTPVSEARQVTIDVKPNSEPSCFNLDGHGSVPAAILGEDDLDPSQVDPESLRLNGLVVLHRGNGQPRCEPEDFDGDGLPDLVCQFDDDPALWTGPDVAATLTGSLRDGTEIEGRGAICLTRPAD